MFKISKDYVFKLIKRILKEKMKKKIVYLKLRSYFLIHLAFGFIFNIKFIVASNFLHLL